MEERQTRGNPRRWKGQQSLCFGKRRDGGMPMIIALVDHASLLRICAGVVDMCVCAHHYFLYETVCYGII